MEEGITSTREPGDADCTTKLTQQSELAETDASLSGNMDICDSEESGNLNVNCESDNSEKQNLNSKLECIRSEDSVQNDSCKPDDRIKPDNQTEDRSKPEDNIKPEHRKPDGIDKPQARSEPQAGRNSEDSRQPEDSCKHECNRASEDNIKPENSNPVERNGSKDKSKLQDKERIDSTKIETKSHNKQAEVHYSNQKCRKYTTVYHKAKEQPPQGKHSSKSDVCSKASLVKPKQHKHKHKGAENTPLLELLKTKPVAPEAVLKILQDAYHHHQEQHGR